MDGEDAKVGEIPYQVYIKKRITTDINNIYVCINVHVYMYIYKLVYIKLFIYKYFLL